MITNILFNRRQRHREDEGQFQRNQIRPSSFYFAPMSTALLVIVILLVLLQQLPSTVSQVDEKQCMEHCHKHRGKGDRQKFTFDCDQVYQDPAEQANCKSFCDHCDDWICDDSIPNVFNCPGVRLNDICQRRCDKSRRPDDTLLSYTLTCDNAYFLVEEIRACQQDCDECPAWVCDSNVDSNTFHCPPRDLDPFCERDCDYVRIESHDKDFVGPFQFLCKDQGLDEDRCRHNCGVCPIMYCNPYYDPGTYNCPAVPPIPHTPIASPPERKYEGRCNDRCEKARLGSKEAFELSCLKAYSTTEEQRSCIADCVHCPVKICDWKAKFLGASTFHCPVNENAVGDKKKSGDASTSSSSSGLSTWAIVGIVVAVLLLVIIGIGIAVYCVKKRKKVGSGTGGAQEANVNPQVSPPPQMLTPTMNQSGGGFQGPYQAPSSAQSMGYNNSPPGGQYSYPVASY